MWLSLVEHCVRDAGVAGSNPATPTIEIIEEFQILIPSFGSCLQFRLQKRALKSVSFVLSLIVLPYIRLFSFQIVALGVRIALS